MAISGGGKITGILPVFGDFLAIRVDSNVRRGGWGEYTY